MWIQVIIHNMHSCLCSKDEQSLDNHGYAGSVIVDLSKAFDGINYELLIEKLHAYGLTKPLVKLVYSYLNNRSHRLNVNTSFTTWKELLMGVPMDLYLVLSFLISI